MEDTSHMSSNLLLGILTISAILSDLLLFILTISAILSDLLLGILTISAILSYLLLGILTISAMIWEYAVQLYYCLRIDAINRNVFVKNVHAVLFVSKYNFSM